MNQRHCRECNEELNGRKDQKFCSDYCRNTFNNRLNEDSNATVRKVIEFCVKIVEFLRSFFQINNV